MLDFHFTFPRVKRIKFFFEVVLCKIGDFLSCLFIDFFLHRLHHFPELLFESNVQGFFVLYLFDMLTVLLILLYKSFLHSIHDFLQFFIWHFLRKYFLFDILTIGNLLFYFLTFFVVFCFQSFTFLVQSCNFFLESILFKFPIAFKPTNFYFLVKKVFFLCG